MQYLSELIDKRKNDMITEKEKHVVRELAKRYMDAICTEKQEKMVQRFRDTNDLKLVRPPVIMDEISAPFLIVRKILFYGQRPPLKC